MIKKSFKVIFLSILLIFSFSNKIFAQSLEDILDWIEKSQEIMKWVEVAYIIVADDDELEKYLHDRVVRQIESQYTIYTSKWLTRIGTTLVKHSDRPYLPKGLTYTFKIVDSKDFNAFAVPGGAIYVTKPLYDALDEDEMPFVLGHEIGHICKKHSIKKVKSDANFLALKEIAKRTLKEDEQIEKLLDAIVTAVSTAVQAGYSRDWEREVDKYGVKLSYSAGYNPEGAVSALSKLADATGAWGASCFLWCTHPTIEERIQLVQKEIQKLRKSEGYPTRSRKKAVELPFEDDFSSYSGEWKAIAGTVEDNRSWDITEGIYLQTVCDEVLRYTYIGNENWENYEIRCRIKFLESGDDGRAGIIFRHQNGDFYLFRICVDSDKAQFRYHTQDPFEWEDLQTHHVGNILINEWYELKVVANGSLFKCFLDGNFIFEIEDNRLANGNVGLHSCEAKVAFDDFSVFPLYKELKQVLAFADFSGFPDNNVKTNCFDIRALGWDNNPYYKHSLRLLYEGSKLKCKFSLDRIPSKAFLIVEHLSSYSEGCPNNGYSPVTIKLNGEIIVSNFSPKSHSMITDTWNITPFLKKGENQISWVAGDLCTHYWIKKWKIVGW